VEGKREEMIAQLQRLLPKVEQGARKAILLFQLAELWWEKASYVSLQEVRQYDERAAAWLAAREKDEKSAGPEPKVSTSASDGDRKEALALYQAVLRDYPEYPRRDELLFVLAYNQYEIGDRAGALRSYQALIDQFPASRFVPDAYVQMGEHWFQHKRPVSRPRRVRESGLVPASQDLRLRRLQAAWCDYNAHDYGAAIAKFQEVVEYSERQAEPRIATASSSRTRRSRTWCCRSRRWTRSTARPRTFRRRRPARRRAHRPAGGTYFESGKFEEAIRVYRLLAAKAPSDARAAAWQQKILLAYDKLNRRDEVAQEMERLVADYGPRSAWSKANAGRANALSEAHELTESALRELVQDYHQEAIKTKNAATYRWRATSTSATWTRSGQRERVPPALLLRRDPLCAREWEPAADQYAQVADKDPKASTRGRRPTTRLALEKSVAIAEGKLQKRELAGAARVDDRQAKDASGRPGPRGRPARRRSRSRRRAEADRRLRTLLGDRAASLRRDRHPLQGGVRLLPARPLAERQGAFGEIVERWPSDRSRRRRRTSRSTS